MLKLLFVFKMFASILFFNAGVFVVYAGSVGSGQAATNAGVALQVSSQAEIESQIMDNLLAFLGDGERYRRESVAEQAAAADFLYAHLKGKATQPNTEVNRIRFRFGGEYYYNIEARINSGVAGSAKQIIIGAHYDNVVRTRGSGESMVISQGVYDNGLAVATLLTLFYNLQGAGADFDFDIVFVFFGAEELGLGGSLHYAANVNKARTLLFINLDVIGVGDNLYIYTYERETVHERFFLDLARDAGVPLNSMPRNRRITFQTLVPIGYSHIGMMSDNTAFANEGILTAFLFSHNLSVRGFALRETAHSHNIMHTVYDNLEHIKQYHPNFLRRTAYVYTLVKGALLSPEFAGVLVYSANNMPSLAFFYRQTHLIIYIISIVVLLFALYFIYQHLKRASANAPISIPTKKVKLSQFIPADIRLQLERELNSRYLAKEHLDSDGTMYVFGKDYES